MEPELGSDARAGDDRRGAAPGEGARRGKRDTRSPDGTVPPLRDPAQASPPRDALRRGSVPVGAARRGGAVEDVLSRVVGVLDASRGYLATFGDGAARRARAGGLSAPARGSGRRRGRVPARRAGGRGGADAREVQAARAPRPDAVGGPDLRRGKADRRPGAGRQGGPARRPGRVRRRGPAVPGFAGRPLRHGDREPPASGEADARAREARGREPPAARRDRAIRGGAALRRRFSGGAASSRPGVARRGFAHLGPSDR